MMSCENMCVRFGKHSKPKCVFLFCWCCCRCLLVHTFTTDWQKTNHSLNDEVLSSPFGFLSRGLFEMRFPIKYSDQGFRPILHGQSKFLAIPSKFKFLVNYNWFQFNFEFLAAERQQAGRQAGGQCRKSFEQPQQQSHRHQPRLFQCHWPQSTETRPVYSVVCRQQRSSGLAGPWLLDRLPFGRDSVRFLGTRPESPNCPSVIGCQVN